MQPSSFVPRLTVVSLSLIAACSSSPPPGRDASGVTTSGTGGFTGTGPVGTGGTQPGAFAGNVGASGLAAGGVAATSGSSGIAGGAPGASGAGVAGGASGLGGAGGGGAGSGAASNPLDKGNFFQSGAWQGYVWASASGAGSNITPMDFAAQPTGMPRCVKGTVAATADYSGTAVLGFNLSEGMGVTSMTITPSKAGVLIDIANKGSSPLRFQIKSAISGGTEWCAPITGNGGFIPWNSLRTKCWESTGTAYDREPIASAMVLVPGTNLAAVPFEFCVNSLAEADMPAGGASGTGGASGAGGAGSGAGGMSGSGGTAGTTPVAGSGGTTAPPITNGCDGYATRFWDCCKPHCGWSANAPAGALASCDREDNSLGGNLDAANSCTGGSAYLCHSNTPWAVSNQLAYGYTAVAARSGADICGKCYQLMFTGSSHNAGNDPGSAALAGKSMIVQAINIGGDVAGGQFDIAMPGGGVGAFNACSMQWGASSSQLGATYGGFLAACKQQVSATDHGALKSCVSQRCKTVFADKGLSELDAGCRFFVDWFQVADNPNLKYAEVACPPEIQNRGIRRGGGGGGSCLR
jgi:hypothetical protein